MAPVATIINVEADVLVYKIIVVVVVIMDVSVLDIIKDAHFYSHPIPSIYSLTHVTPYSLTPLENPDLITR